MEFLLKLDYFTDNDKINIDLIKAIDDGEVKKAKLTTNEIRPEYDRKDERIIKAFKNVKMIFKLEQGGCLIVKGSLECSFRQPFGGSLFVWSIIIDSGLEYKEVKGVECTVCFSNTPMSIESMQSQLMQLTNEKNFLYNLSQFDEFMDIFKYYKKLSEEFNNDKSFEIKSISKKYYYAPVTIKNMSIDRAKELKGSDGVIKGYIVDSNDCELLENEIRDEVLELVDIKINSKTEDMKRIKSMFNNIYLSDSAFVSENSVSKLKSLNVINITTEKENIILSVEYDGDIESRYVVLYDLGQKVKVDSIDNSLRLINQGASSSAIELLEYLIGDTKIPTIKKLKTSNKKEQYTSGLNESQKEAFLKAVDGSPVTLIKGPPGTGKTHVINAITQFITKELNEKVVISSQTHVAIDNVLDKLMENYDLIIPNRITNRKNKYSGEEIDNTLHKTWAKKFDEHNKRSSNSKLAAEIQNDMKRFQGKNAFTYYGRHSESNYQVIGATTTTSKIAGKKGLDLLKDYRWLIIDEVSKCPITEVLRYLPYIENIIMVGDDCQLAPLLEFTKEEVQSLPSFDEDKFDKLQAIYENSVFASTLKKAEKAGRLIVLNENYRSVKDILRAYKLFYNVDLINKREIVNSKKVTFVEEYDFFNKKDIYFVSVKNGKENKDEKSHSRYNIEELGATACLLEDLIKGTKNPSTVTVSAIFPYAAQISRFSQKHLDLINRAKKTFKIFEIDTVDAFQGKESDIVLVNTVVTDSSLKNFLNDFRRINVSMSRAKDKLFVFGNPITLKRIEMSTNEGNKRTYFKDILDDIQRFGKIIEYTSEGGAKYETSSSSKIKII